MNEWHPGEVSTATRSAALAEYRIFDTPPEENFDRLTRVAASVCDTPIAAITFLDVRRQWFKSRVGLEATETPIEDSFCAFTGEHPGRTMIVPDATQDPRFRANLLVTGEPHIRFYAGAPIMTAAGIFIGAVCVISPQARRLNTIQDETLRCLASWVAHELEQRVVDPSRGHSCPSCGFSLKN